MDIQKWLNDQNIEAVQDRKDGKNYWMYDNLYTEIDLIELLEAFSLHVVGRMLCEHNNWSWNKYPNKLKCLECGEEISRA